MLSPKQQIHDLKERTLRKSHMKLPGPIFTSTNQVNLPDIQTRPATAKKSLREFIGSPEPEQPFYESYREKMFSIKDIIKNFSIYRKTREKSSMLMKRRAARMRSLYDLMDKDLVRSPAKLSSAKGSTIREGRKIETLVRRDAYEISQKNLTTLGQLIEKLNIQYHRSKIFD